ncbi:MAG: response regulator [Thermoplasmatota archaeon]
MTVLLVEDDEWDALAARNAFAKSALAPVIDIALDGVEALEYLRRDGKPLPDLILLDLNLPRMDGREFLGHVKTDERLRRIPVIVLTTSKAQKDILKAYDLHANAYLNKPFDPEEYPAIVHAIEEFWFARNVAPGA